MLHQPHHPRRYILWLPPVLWAVVIFFLSATSAPPVPPLDIPAYDKIGHMAVYGFLGFLITHALRRAHHLSVPRAALIAILLVAAYGASDEWHQSFVPDRDASLADWFADILGGSLAQLIHWYDARPSRKTTR